MTSMRKLRRRLLRWERYVARTCYSRRVGHPWAWQPPSGYRRAIRALAGERRRRVTAARRLTEGLHPPVVTVADVATWGQP